MLCRPVTCTGKCLRDISGKMYDRGLVNGSQQIGHVVNSVVIDAAVAISGCLKIKNTFL